MILPQPPSHPPPQKKSIKSCEKVEVAALSSPFLMVRTVSVDVKATLEWNSAMAVFSDIFRTSKVFAVNNSRYPVKLTIANSMHRVQFSSVQNGIYVLGKAYNYALHPVSHTFPKHYL